MKRACREIVSSIAQTLEVSVKAHPELRSLLSSLNNFRRKYGCWPTSPSCLVILDKESYDQLIKTVDRQSDEIHALDIRIKRLLER